MLGRCWAHPQPSHRDVAHSGGMSDENAPDQYPVEPEAKRPSRFARIRERAGGLTRGASRGTVVGVIAGLVIGGAGGFAVATAATDGDHGGPGDRGDHGRPFDDRGGDDGGHPDLNG